MSKFERGVAESSADAETDPQQGQQDDDLSALLIDQQQPDPAADRPERQTSHFQRFVIGSQNFSKLFIALFLSYKHQTNNLILS